MAPITDLAAPALTDIGADLLEIGSVRLGYKGPKGEPRKLQSFIICDRRMEQVKLADGRVIERPMIRLDIMQRIAKRVGVRETVKVGDLEVPKLIELDVLLVYDDPALNFFTYRGSYSAARVLCKGFGRGTEARRYDEAKDAYYPLPCPGADCPWTYEGQTAEHPGCKAHGVLSFLLKDDPVLGGVYVFRTTSVQSIGGILAGMQAVARFTGGKLGGLAMRLRCVEAQSKAQVRGRSQTRKYTLATIGFAGDVRQMLDEASHMFEARARLNAFGTEYEKTLLGKMRAGPEAEDPEEVRRIAEEFQPTEQEEDEEVTGSSALAAPVAEEAAKALEAKAARSPESTAHQLADATADPRQMAQQPTSSGREALLAVVRAAMEKMGGRIGAVRDHVLKHEAGPWVHPTRADDETLGRYAACLVATGVVVQSAEKQAPPPAREPGDDDIPF